MNRILFLLAASAVVVACSNSKDASQTANVMQVLNEGFTVTQQDMHPGQPGMVRKIRTYAVSGVATIDAECELYRFRVDSLQFPIQQVKVNGERMQEARLSKGEALAVSFSVSRPFKDGKKTRPLGVGQGARILNEDGLERSGILLEGTAQLVVVAEGDTLTVDLGAIEALPDVFAP